MTDYSESFYRHQMEGSVNSARVVVPLVMEIVAPDSVIDIGCGTGSWLAVYAEHGVHDFTGIDGDYVKRELLLIDPARFRAHDLNEPLPVERRVDLVQCLEVAEHLDGKNAGRLVSNLTALSDVILFSAAVPFQLGTGHINEQYLDYWVKLFADNGYHPVDCIRPHIWNDDRVEVCYRQNILLFAEKKRLATDGRLKRAARLPAEPALSLIHPKLYDPRIKRLLDTLLDFATRVFSNGNHPLAREMATSIVDFDPRHDRGWSLLGQIAAMTGNTDQSLQFLQRAAALAPETAAHHYNLAQVLRESGNPDAAEACYRKAIELSPGNTAYRQALAGLRHR